MHALPRLDIHTLIRISLSVTVNEILRPAVLCETSD